MKDLCHFRVNFFTSSFQTFCIQGGIFFPCHNLKADIKAEKTIFKMAKGMPEATLLMVNKNGRSKTCFC